MRNLLGSIVLCTMGALANTACAEPLDGPNTIVLNKQITRETMGPVAEKMTQMLSQDRAPREVNIIINSPGGSVYTGFQFISQMKALQGKGTKFVCYVPGLAASMAFHILVHCDQRIVLQESALLWHRARVFIMFGVVTSTAASALARDLAQIDEHILADVRRELSKDMSEEDISYHFEHETLHIGQKLCSSAPHFCTSKASVPGLLEALQSASEEDKKRGTEEESAAQFTGIESIIYIYQRYLNGLTEEE